MKILWNGASVGQPPTEKQYQERFWRRRLDGIGLDVVTKEFLAIEFKRTQDKQSRGRDSGGGPEAVQKLADGSPSDRSKQGWKEQQLVFVGETCGSVHVESFNSNMKALGVLESKWD
jgi:hypothetical protein